MHFLKYTIFFISLTLPAYLHAGCLQDHLKEAIESNTQRLMLYSQLTAGQSEKVSKKLIHSEKLALFISRFGPFNFDSKFEKFLKYGVNVTCDSFISMKNAPTFQFLPNMNTVLIQNATQEVQPNANTLVNELKVELKKQQINIFKDKIKKTIQSLNDEPQVNCMTRHTLESAARIASYFEYWKSKITLIEDKKEFEHLIFRLLKAHLFAASKAIEIDQLARPLNLAGIPILCQDIPPIPIFGISNP